MAKLTANIQDELGLHVKLATQLVQIASKFFSTITLKANGQEANAKSVINVVALSINKNDQIELVVIGEDEDAALNEIKTFLVENKVISL